MPILIIVLGVGSLWDGFTTVFGTTQILGDKDAQVAVSFVFACVITGFLLGTAFIMKTDGMFGLFFKIFWGISLVYDLYTSYIGNLRFIMEGEVNSEQQVILIGITLLITASPILLSWIWQDS